MIKRLVIIGLFTVACASAPSPRVSAGGDARKDILVALDDSVYAYGDTAAVTLVNHADGEMLFAFMCDGFVEGWVGDGWRTVYEPDCSAIRVRPTRLAPGDSTGTILRMAPCEVTALAEYGAFRLRVRFQFANSSGGYQVTYSRRFRITAP